MLFCDKCDGYRDTRIIERPATFHVNGGIVKLMRKLSICRVCELEVYDEKLGNETLAQVRQAIKEGDAILVPRYHTKEAKK